MNRRLLLALFLLLAGVAFWLYRTNTGSTINIRPVSNWTGGASDGLWSSAGNWDALPDEIGRAHV